MVSRVKLKVGKPGRSGKVSLGRGPKVTVGAGGGGGKRAKKRERPRPKSILAIMRRIMT